MRRPRTRSASPPTLEETTSASGRRLPVAVTGLVVGLVQAALELLGLRGVAGEPVEKEPLLRVGLAEALLDHLDGDLVGHQVPGVDVALGLLAQLGAVVHVLAEQVAGRDVRGPETL